jgi:phage terminase small subunit
MEAEYLNESKQALGIVAPPLPGGMLNARQQLFCEKFIELGFNGYQAALQAGYSQKNAGVSANALLNNPKVSDYIKQRKQQLLEEVGVNQFRILKELANIAFADIRNYYTEAGALKRPSELSAEAAAALICVDVFEMFDTEGNKVGETKRTRFHDKMRALEMLGRYLGMFEKDNKQKPADVNIFEVTLNLK